MITVDFSQHRNQTLCDSVYISIRQQILDGSLRANEKLPSKRILAQHLGISIITIQNAYGRLISEGYIYSIEKKGYFVTDIQKEITVSRKAAAPVPVSKSLTPAEEKKQFIADFTSNSTSVEKFPFSLWSHTMRQVLNTQDESLLERTGLFGASCLRKAIAGYLREFRNMNVDESQIVIGAGTESVYSTLVQLLGRDKIYAVENPGYHKAGSVFELNGAHTVPVEMDRSGISIEQLKKSKAMIAHVSPSHHFPTGIVMPIKRRMELLSWASEDEGRYIIEDDYDSEFRFNGKPLPTLLDSDTGGKVIYINTFSKTLSPSFRISYMILPQSLVNVFRERLGFFSCQVSAFEQHALALFMENGSFEKHIIRMKNHYRTLRNQLIQGIEESRLKDISQILEEESGLHFLLRVNSRQPGQELKERLMEKGIRVNLLEDYGYNVPDRGDRPLSFADSGDRPLGTGYNAADRGDRPLKQLKPDGGDRPLDPSFPTLVLNYSGIRKEAIPAIIAAMEFAIIPKKNTP